MFPKQTKRILIVAFVLYVATLFGCIQSAKGQSIHAETRRCTKYETLLRKYQLPVREFSTIMWRESRCQPRAIGWNYRAGKSASDCRLSPAVTYKRCRAVKSFDSGLLQINSSWVSVTAAVCRAKRGDLSVLLIPDCNIRVAKYLYENGGMHHWKASSGNK